MLSTVGVNIGASPIDARAVQIVELEGLGGTYSFASGLNESGIAVGSAMNADGRIHAVRWDVHGRITDLGMLAGGYQSDATAITANGWIFGGAIAANFQHHAVRWAPGGAIEDLGVLPGGDSSEALAINNAGTVVGLSSKPIGNSTIITTGVSWDRNGVIRELSPTEQTYTTGINNAGDVVGYVSDKISVWHPDGSRSTFDTPPGYLSGYPVRITDGGTIVGSLLATDLSSHAVAWNRNGAITYLRALPGGAGSNAFAIARGAIIGIASVGPGLEPRHGVRWDLHGRITDLGTLPGGSTSETSGINDGGAIVGSSTTANGDRHAVVWTSNRIHDLGTLPGGTLSIAYRINNSGRIIGVATDAAGNFRAVAARL
jgi:probable HAF family extracellular repeat protein